MVFYPPERSFSFKKLDAKLAVRLELGTYNENYN